MLYRHMKFCLFKKLVDRSIFYTRAFSLTSARHSIENPDVPSKLIKEKKSIYRFPLMFFSPEAPRATDFSLVNLRNWWKHMQEDHRRTSQMYDAKRHAILGHDLASAYFILNEGGRVKFKYDEKWITSDDCSSLPNEYNLKYILIALDASGLPLVYEGLNNLYGLLNLKWLSFKGCKYLDDWCLDKISAEFPKLEYLDISNCENITERGLEALYRMLSLKTLIVTNHYKSITFELTCLMLEECNPQLTCTILELNETIAEK